MLLLQIFGTFKTTYVDYTSLPNFYEVYSSPTGTHKKPMAIPETASLWDLSKITGSPTELQVKSGWWEQVCYHTLRSLVLLLLALLGLALAVLLMVLLVLSQGS